MTLPVFVQSVASCVKMPNTNSCLERAAECKRKAELVADPGARNAWLKLAEQWVAFSQIPFHRTAQPKAESPAAERGLWRGAL
jgi:hypothetical protein